MEERYPLKDAARILKRDLATLYRWRKSAGLLEETAEGMTWQQIEDLATAHHVHLVTADPSPVDPLDPTGSQPIIDHMAIAQKLAQMEATILNLVTRVEDLEQQPKAARTTTVTMLDPVQPQEIAHASWTAQDLLRTLPNHKNSRVEIPADLDPDSLPASLFCKLHNINGVASSYQITRPNPLKPRHTQIYLTPESQKLALEEIKKSGQTIKPCPRPWCPCHQV